MKTITMLELRQRAQAVLNQVSKGRTFVVTYRGKPVARLEPIATRAPTAEDPIYKLDELASPSAEPLTNAEIDRAVYGA